MSLFLEFSPCMGHGKTPLYERGIFYRFMIEFPLEPRIYEI